VSQRRQLRGTARARGEEAVDELQHRTRVKPREAGLVEASVLETRRPIFNRCQDGVGDGSGRILIVLTPRDLFGSAQAVGRKEVKTTAQSPWRSRISP
jgi:hypothetical protein